MMGLLKRKVRLQITEQENGAVIFDKTHGSYLQTNQVGVYILKLLSEQKTVPEVVENVAETFSISREQAEADVSEFVASLREAGIA